MRWRRRDRLRWLLMRRRRRDVHGAIVRVVGRFFFKEFPFLVLYWGIRFVFFSKHYSLTFPFGACGKKELHYDISI
jgi:hypothetical protein